ncbi:hypothetical protein VTP01DRAFT_10532 [Rhizomucor pusillus]|uniref:uncharacterized protein n=1 Tax=Rhizomucor pusillus TaxID=4840 RepID=UPI00374400ED
MKDVLRASARSRSRWQQLCRDLLQPSDPPDLSDSQQQTDSAPPAYYNLGGLLAKTREQQKGAFTRPYYQLVAFTLDECRTRNWQFPPDVINSSTHISAITNTERIQEIQQEMSQILARCDNEDEDEQKLERFLFEFLEPADWRLFLRLKTTAGGNTLSEMPPSLNECVKAFCTIHRKQSSSSAAAAKPNQLTVGAKALSKHWHRDRKTQFWGSNFNGTEAAKNERAEDILVKILKNTVWRNLHTLPHNEIVYEVRQSEGYGARWIRRGSNRWEFRGFLEPQMEDGHTVGWIH